ncbi:flagellar export chaperone FliS [Bacillota bacterium LX-D]|nr:flagellar export chaperone FliS [Bacillota bacterium LX-D]
MNSVQAYQTYQKNQVTTVSSEKLVTMLYDGALRFILQAKEGIAAKDLEKANTNFLKAQRIIAELMSNLDMEVGEISTNLFSLYQYMYERLMEANLKKDSAVAGEVYELLIDLRNTWVEAVKSLNSKAPAAQNDKLTK